MQTISTTLYTFSELSEYARAKARQTIFGTHSFLDFIDKSLSSLEKIAFEQVTGCRTLPFLSLHIQRIHLDNIAVLFILDAKTENDIKEIRRITGYGGYVKPNTHLSVSVSTDSAAEQLLSNSRFGEYVGGWLLDTANLIRERVKKDFVWKMEDSQIDSYCFLNDIGFECDGKMISGLCG